MQLRDLGDLGDLGDLRDSSTASLCNYETLLYVDLQRCLRASSQKFYYYISFKREVAKCAVVLPEILHRGGQMGPLNLGVAQQNQKP